MNKANMNKAMTNKAIAVIGANYGDEGKGATVHYLVKHTKATTVIRHNGANQAGHTVQIKNGPRHVFSNYGSGSFVGAQTYISNLALFNPLSVLKEKQALAKLKQIPPPIVVHPDTNIITPFDIALNQFLEKGRGVARHGSCGMGIGETMFRILSKNGPKITAKQLMDPSFLFMFINDIRRWFKTRVTEETKAGNFTYLTEVEREGLFDLIRYPTLLVTETYKYTAAIQTIDLEPLNQVLGETDTVIFEGAQGLLLDEDDPLHQPHVTWSKTGLTNILKECTSYNLDLQEIYYVTRPYLTRHGEGPIHAGVPCENTWGKDKTNVENDFQGGLKYAVMDWVKFCDRVRKDASALRDPKVKVKIAMTCLDQIENADELVGQVQALTNFEVVPIDGLNG